MRRLPGNSQLVDSQLLVCGKNLGAIFDAALGQQVTISSSTSSQLTGVGAALREGHGRSGHARSSSGLGGDHLVALYSVLLVN